VTLGRRIQVFELPLDNTVGKEDIIEPMASAIFLFIGLGVTLVGVILILLARFEKPAPPGPGEEAFDIGKIIEQINKMLELVEQKYRVGIVLMAVGLSLVGVGVFLEAKAAKDEAKKSTPAAVASVLRHHAPQFN
jgi:uncharacterized membrane protein